MSPSVEPSGGAPGQLGLPALALRRVGHEVVRVLRRHQARPGERQRDPAGVDRDPAPTPLLGDVGGRAGAAGRVEDEVAGVGGHEEAALDHSVVRLDNVDLGVGEPANRSVRPQIGQRHCRVVGGIPLEPKRVPKHKEASRGRQARHAFQGGLPVRVCRCPKDTTSELEGLSILSGRSLRGDVVVGRDPPAGRYASGVRIFLGRHAAPLARRSFNELVLSGAGPAEFSRGVEPPELHLGPLACVPQDVVTHSAESG